MSMATLERSILSKTREFLQNPKLRMKDILEWSTGDIKAENDGEVVMYVPEAGVNICIQKAEDKRRS